VEKSFAALLDDAVRTGLNLVLVGEAGTGKERGARFLHARKKGAFFYRYDCLTDEVERWSLVATFLTELEKGLSQIPDQKETRFLKDIQFLDQKQINALLDRLHTKLLGNQQSSSLILRAGLVCSCEPERAKLSPWKELMVQFFPYEITVPPLRERRAEIPFLVSEFISEWTQAHQTVIGGIDDRALNLLEEYYWPGNISELKSVLRQACAFADNHGIISAELIEKRIRPSATVIAGGGLNF
jgi:transcriptional regulator with AAA-type ATPase domain